MQDGEFFDAIIESAVYFKLVAGQLASIENHFSRQAWEQVIIDVEIDRGIDESVRVDGIHRGDGSLTLRVNTIKDLC